MITTTQLFKAGACFAVALAAATANAETIEGELTDDDAVDDTFGGYADTYEIDVEEGQLLVIELGSDDFDTYLILTAPDGTTYRNDDDNSTPGFNTDSRLVAYAHEGGAWTITATSFGEEGVGDYTLDHTTAAVETLLTEEGELTEDDDRSVKRGEFYDAYVFEAEAGQTLLIALDSEDFDAYLTVYLPDGTILTNDDAVDFNAQVIATVGEAGEVTIIATSNGSGEVGAYELNVRGSE
ncbi:PPC domain-containing protein [Phycisphaeraceae bacterium D3-23]